MKILLTRSNEENVKFEKDFTPCVAEIYSLPLIKHYFLGLDAPYLSEFDTIIITSKFAAQKVPQSPARIFKVRVVGDVSASILKEKGYEVVQIAANAAEVRDALSVKDGKILYLRGRHISTEMPDFVTSKIIYNTEYRQELEEKDIAFIEQIPDYILLYSENCAKTLFQLISKYNLENKLKSSIIVAMSDKVGNIFSKVCAEIIVQDSNEKILNYLKYVYGQEI